VRMKITLDEDVQRKLEVEVHRQKGVSFQGLVNELLRIGLLTKGEWSAIESFQVQARSMGVKPGLNYDKTTCLLDEFEEVQRE
jgi:hypothetical protein